jgi:predicted nuclease of predicted toxin-antitoxin system
MRFLADENVSRLVIQRLRAGGFDVASIMEETSGVSDTAVLEIAGSGARILITEDRDFGELVIRQKLAVRGVVLLELDRLSNLGEADRVSEIVQAYLNKLEGNLVVVEPSRVRIRPLRK